VKEKSFAQKLFFYIIFKNHSYENKETPEKYSIKTKASITLSETL
jgi:hypothetical protein